MAVGREDGSIFITSLELPFQTIRIETIEHVQLHTNANSHLPAATFQNAGASQISNQSIETIVAMTKGFAVCSRGGFVGTYERIIDPVSGEDKFNCNKQFPRPEEWGCSQIRTIALSTTESTLLVELISNQILKLPLVTSTEKLKVFLLACYG